MCDCNIGFVFNDTATTEIYALSLHDALPISRRRAGWGGGCRSAPVPAQRRTGPGPLGHRTRSGARVRTGTAGAVVRSEEHTSELQSRQYLVCRLLLEKKQKLERVGRKRETKP